MGYKVALVGATGNVGREMLSILDERKFPADEVVALALRLQRRRYLPDVGGRRGVEGMVAENRRRRRGRDR
jgi:aspartate-semialdehyde dehydrogenase